MALPSFTAVTGATYTAAQYNTYVRDNLDTLFAKAEGLYPVGSIYTSTVATNPNTLFGFGTWAAFGAGRVLVSRDATQTEFDTVEETGGAKTHTLTTTEMPAHTHSFTARGGTQNVDSGAQGATSIYDGSYATGSAGSGGAHNNLQPYIVVYMWKRTA